MEWNHKTCANKSGHLWFIICHQTNKKTNQANKEKPSFNDLPWIVPFPTKIMLGGGEQTANVTQDPERSWFKLKHAESHLLGEQSLQLCLKCMTKPNGPAMMLPSWLVILISYCKSGQKELSCEGWCAACYAWEPSPTTDRMKHGLPHF